MRFNCIEPLTKYNALIFKLQKSELSILIELQNTDLQSSK